jgi:hypothetical protein
MVTQENVTRFAMQAADATNPLAIVGRLHDKPKSIKNTLIELGSLTGRRSRLVGFVKFGLETN